MIRGDMAQGSYILFTVAGTTYALRSDDVRHMEMIDEITCVPNAPSFVDGVVFSRGRSCRSSTPAVWFDRAAIDIRSRLIVVQSGTRLIGLVVDAAREFVNIPAELVQPPHEALAGMSGRTSRDRVDRDRLILILDLERILNFGEAVQMGLTG
jgi:purine-binding chemotaxis protein CheW